jgi:hypothetical protein
MMFSKKSSPSAAHTLDASRVETVDEGKDENELVEVSFSGQSTSSSVDRTVTKPGLEIGASDGAKELREKFFRKEEGAVRKSRIMVGAAVVLCAVAVSIAVYVIAEESEQHSFNLEVRRSCAPFVLILLPCVL